MRTRRSPPGPRGCRQNSRDREPGDTSYVGRPSQFRLQLFGPITVLPWDYGPDAQPRETQAVVKLIVDLRQNQARQARGERFDRHGDATVVDDASDVPMKMTSGPPSWRRLASCHPE